MRYADKSFTVPTWHPPKDCAHGWLDKRGKCVMCGEKVGEPTPDHPYRTACGSSTWINERGHICFHQWHRLEDGGGCECRRPPQSLQDAPQRDDGGERDG